MRLKILPVILLAMAIAFSPRLPVGQFESIGGTRLVEIRAEDILLLFFCLVSVVNFLVSGKTKIRKPPLFYLIIIWLSFGFLSVLVNWFLGILSFNLGFFYFLKEIEFFILYFFVFYQISDLDSAKFLTKLWMFLGLINTAWIVYQIIAGTHITYYYGPTSFMEPTGPFPSGGFFLMLFIFLSNVFIFHFLGLKTSLFKKIVLGLLCLSPVIGVISSGSRASIVGLAVAIFTSLFLYLLVHRNFSAIRRILGVVGFVLIVFVSNAIFFKVSFFFRPPTWENIAWEYSSEDSPSRISILKADIEELRQNPFYLILGRGVRGELHSQYMRVLVERGIFGLFLFFLLVAKIIKKSFNGACTEKDSFSVGLSAGLFSATFALLVASIPSDVFMVVKVAEPYWFFAAMALRVLTFTKSPITINNTNSNS